MTADTMEERKRKISQIKASFPEAGHSAQYRDFSAPEPEEGVAGGYFKWKLLIAIALFAALVFLDQNEIRVADFSTEQVYSRIQETVSVEKAIQTLENMVK